MPTITATDIADLVNSTLRELGRLNYQQIAQSRPDYPLFVRWFQKKNVMLDTGIGIQRTLLNRLPDTARHVGLAEPDSVTIMDLTDQLQVNWVHATQSWGVIHQEILMNAGPQVIYNIIKPRREMAMLNLIELISRNIWSAPSSSSDKLTPYGIPYYIVKNATTGFNGGAPSGHTTVAGVSLTDSPTYKNYTFTYALTGGMSKTDFIPKCRNALRQCRFRSPVPGSDYTKTAGQYCLYVNSTTAGDLETIGESQNENIGRDIAPSAYSIGSLAFRGFDIIWEPELDSDTTNPVYGIDHSTFIPYGLRGDWFRESENRAARQHNIVEHHIDLTYNYVCVDRRRNFVAYGTS